MGQIVTTATTLYGVGAAALLTLAALAWKLLQRKKQQPNDAGPVPKAEAHRITGPLLDAWEATWTRRTDRKAALAEARTAARQARQLHTEDPGTEGVALYGCGSEEEAQDAQDTWRKADKAYQEFLRNGCGQVVRTLGILAQHYQISWASNGRVPTSDELDDLIKHLDGKLRKTSR